MTGVEPTPPAPEPGPDAGIVELRADINRTRAQLGDTVEALSAKVNVPERARAKAEAAKPTLVLTGSAAAVALIGLLWWRRRRH